MTFGTGFYSKYKKLKDIHKEFKLSYSQLILHYFKKTKVEVISNNGSKYVATVYSLVDLSTLLHNNWFLYSSFGDTIKLKGPDNEIIACRTLIGFDLGHLIEIYINKTYGSDFKDKNVIDIGMSNGDSSIYFAKMGAKRVIGLEPDIRNFKIATENIKASDVSGLIMPINKALGQTNGTIELSTYEKHPNANSIDEENMVALKDNIITQKVESISLTDIIKLFNGQIIDYLKMDCEGCEYAVLRNLDSSSFKKIIEIVMEYHHGLQDLEKILTSNSFDLKIVPTSKYTGIVEAKKNINKSN